MIKEIMTKISIHPLLWLVMAIAVITAHFYALFTLFVIIIIHEMGHVVAARFFSWRISKIVLLPFGGVAEMDEHGNRPIKEELIVTIAGPIQHIWLMALGVFMNQISFISDEQYTLFMSYNLMILLFNLLPIWPLDGGKLLFILLSHKQSFTKAFSEVLLLSGIVVLSLATVLILLNPYHLHLWIVLVYISFILVMEWKQRHYVFMRFLLERYYGKKTELISLKPLAFEKDVALIHVLQSFQRGVKHPIIILNDGQEKGVLDENELLHAYFSDKLTTAKIGDLLYSY